MNLYDSDKKNKKNDFTPEWIYEKKAMQKKYRGVRKKHVSIKDVPSSVAAIAYSTDEPAIYIRKDTKFTAGLNARYATIFRFGVFTRELLKHEYTNFDHQNKLAESLEEYERPMFRLFCSMVENAAVEILAPTFVGGALLDSLRFASKKIYDGLELIDTAKTPFEEFLLAFEQMAEIGKLKGRFATPAARTIFYKCSGVIVEAVEENNSEKRADLCLQIHNTSKPLWEDEALEKYNKAKLGNSAFSIEDIFSMLGSVGWAIGGSMGSFSGSGTEVDQDEAEELSDYSKGAFRKTVVKDLKGMEEPESIENEEESISIEEEEEQKFTEYNYSTAPDGNDHDEIEFDSSREIDLSTTMDYDPEQDEIAIAGCDFFDKLVLSELELSVKEDKAAAATEISEPFDLPEISKKYSSRNFRCLNLAVLLENRTEAMEGYTSIVQEFEELVNNSYKKLKALFAEDAEEIIYKSSGKLSLKRSMKTTVSTKMFTKKVEPKDKSDLAVMILIDESGSMSGTRIKRAKAAAINLAEIFKRLNIPLYIMGFTADDKGYHAIHSHYAMWSATTENLLKLTGIRAKSNNFDGYSIRYASKVLEKRPESHKVLIVISDGQPAANAYHDLDGYSDTKDAIREARGKGQSVLGVAIGADLELLQKMYGSDFVFIESSDDLFSGIINKFTNMVKKW